MDVLSIISAELEQWELVKQDAITRYNKASTAIETLWQLTERMKQEVENESHHKSSGKETEAASGD